MSKLVKTKERELEDQIKDHDLKMNTTMQKGKSELEKELDDARNSNDKTTRDINKEIQNLKPKVKNT